MVIVLAYLYLALYAEIKLLSFISIDEITFYQSVCINNNCISKVTNNQNAIAKAKGEHNTDGNNEQSLSYNGASSSSRHELGFTS